MQRRSESRVRRLKMIRRNGFIHPDRRMAGSSHPNVSLKDLVATDACARCFGIPALKLFDRRTCPPRPIAPAAGASPRFFAVPPVPQVGVPADLCLLQPQRDALLLSILLFNQ